MLHNKGNGNRAKLGRISLHAVFNIWNKLYLKQHKGTISINYFVNILDKHQEKILQDTLGNSKEGRGLNGFLGLLVSSCALCFLSVCLYYCVYRLFKVRKALHWHSCLQQVVLDITKPHREEHSTFIGLNSTYLKAELSRSICTRFSTVMYYLLLWC